MEDRYSKINAELNEECKKRIREIDAHLLAIQEKFPAGLYKVMNEEIIPMFKDLGSDARLAYRERLELLRMSVEKTKAVINQFMQIRQDFHDKVRDYQIDEHVSEVIKQAAGDLLGVENVHKLIKTLGAEDFGSFMENAPGAMFNLGVQKNGHEDYELHHPKFDLDERALPLGTAVLVETALRFLRGQH